MDIERCSFYAQTVQGSVIRNLSELLKDVLIEANLVATNDGLRLLAMESTNGILTAVNLNAVSFEKYHCPSRVVLGLSLGNLHRLLKTASNSDVISLWTMPAADKLYIRIENTDRGSATEYKLNLVDIDERGLEPPACEFTHVLTLPSHDFQRLLRDMALISTTVFISNDDASLTLSCKGDFAEQNTVLTQNQNLMINKTTEDEPDAPMGTASDDDANEFVLKYLIQFCRGSSLSPSVNLFLQAGKPIIIKFAAATLGEILFCLSPLAPIS